MGAGIDRVEFGSGLRTDVERPAVRRDGKALGQLRQPDAIDDGAAVDVDDDDVIALHRGERFAGRVADRDPMRRIADVDALHFVGFRIDDQHGIAKLAGAPDRAGLIHHDAVRRIGFAEIDHARERL